jgi:hypothetical protein
MDFGKHQLAKITYGGNDYYLIVNKVDADGGMVEWYFYITKGDWQAATPEIISEPNSYVSNIPLSGNGLVPDSTDPQPMIDAAVAQMNTMLAGLFTPAPSPTAFVSKLDDDCSALQLTSVNGVVQVKKQNFGINVGLNKYLAKIFSYTGDFSGGQFNAWAILNGVSASDIAAAIAKYNAG